MIDTLVENSNHFTNKADKTEVFNGYLALQYSLENISSALTHSLTHSLTHVIEY